MTTSQLPSVVCLGELLVDFVSVETGCTLAGSPGFQKAPAGAPANVAAGVARLGVPSAFLGKVGDDPFGEFLVECLDSCGVNTRGIVRDRDARTTLAFVSLAENGEREFVFYRNPGADQRYVLDDLAEDLIRGSKIFHFGSISMTTEPARSATLRAARIAKSAGKIVSLDPNVRQNLWNDDATLLKAIAEGAALADIMKVSEEELPWLPPNLSPRLLLITKGAKGCRWRTAEAESEIVGFPVESIDTTGAGDAFWAAMLSRLAVAPEAIQDRTFLNEACRFANAAGALATLKRGAIPALPDRSAIENFLAALPSSTA